LKLARAIYLLSSSCHGILSLFAKSTRTTSSNLPLHQSLPSQIQLIQPGIEGFSDEVLNLMRKGVSGF
jgi:hypothetical protein